MPGNVLAAHGTTNGSTAEVAEAVAVVLRREGLAAEALPTRSVRMGGTRAAPSATGDARGSTAPWSAAAPQAPKVPSSDRSARSARVWRPAAAQDCRAPPRDRGRDPGHLLSLTSAPSSAARPASSRATGTRNGEQET